jgi:O-acetyl-ADP-ribose deacetylase (regulator of RNase III)
VGAVVSPDHELLSMSAGVALEVREAAGSDVIRADVKKYPPVRAGRVVVTTAGELDARFVFHAVVGASLNERATPSRDLLTEVLHGCVYHADALGLVSLALPLLGTEGGTFPEDVCLDTLVRFWVRTLSAGATAVRDVRIVLHKPRTSRRPRRRPL